MTSTLPLETDAASLLSGLIIHGIARSRLTWFVTELSYFATG